MTTTDPGEIDLERVYRIADSMDKAIGIPNLDDGTLLRELAATVKALRDDLADLEALRAEDHAAIRQMILEKEAVEAREVELAGALENCVSLVKLKVGSIDLTGDAAIKQACTALATTPAQAMERARASHTLTRAAQKIEALGWQPVGSQHRAEIYFATNDECEAFARALDIVRGAVSTKLDALGKEQG